MNPLKFTSLNCWFRTSFLDRGVTDNQHSHVSPPPMSPRVLRRFPSLRKEGLVAGGIFSRKQKNPMTELLYFIQRNPHSHLLKDVKLKPAHWWKPAVPALGDLPAQMVKLLNPERGYTAKLIRSPERVMGVGDILGRSAKVRSFSFSDLLCRGYTHDFRVIVCLTLVFGFWRLSFIVQNNIPPPFPESLLLFHPFTNTVL